MRAIEFYDSPQGKSTSKMWANYLSTKPIRRKYSVFLADIGVIHIY
jgi:hypothetical protein